MRLIFSIIVMLVLFGACSSNKTRPQPRLKNVLNLEATPKSRYKLQGFGFSDLGAWHGFALPQMDSTENIGGFSGPLLMKMYGQWLSKSLCTLQLTDAENMPIRFDKSKTELNSLPGRLEQKLGTDKLEIDLQLLFADRRTSVILTKITNSSDESVEFTPTWKGTVDWEDIKFESGVQHFDFILADSSRFESCFSVPLQSISFKAGRLKVIAQKTVLKPGETLEVELAQRYTFNEDAKMEVLSQLNTVLANVQTIEQDNTKRWEEYLSNVGVYELDEQKKKLAAKCIQTLITNWRSPAGALKHNGIFPSAAYQGFYGFWSWDSWKHSVAVVKFNPFLAKEGIRSMFDFQNEAGMVADCVYFDPKENNWRDTKAPLAAWAVYEVYKATGDSEFVHEMLPKLEKYHEWWYAERDHDKNGLCEYGSTDGTLVAAKWESGMDNAVRFDKATILKNSETAWSFNQESIDLNAYLQKEKEYLAKLFKVVGNTQQQKRYEEETIALAQIVRTHFWNEEKGFFFDREIHSGDFIPDFGPEGWTSLWTQLASKEQAEQVIRVILDSSRFNTFIPFPTLDASHQKFNPLKGYWRGPVWLDQVYFEIEALHNYGYNKEASALTNKLLSNAEGLQGTAPIRENYHPITGEGLNANHFSWSAAHLLMLIDEKHANSSNK